MRGVIGVSESESTQNKLILKKNFVPKNGNLAENRRVLAQATPKINWLQYFSVDAHLILR
jgi:hypothetical protein